MAHRGDRQGHRERGGPRATPATDDGDHHAEPVGLLEGYGESLDEPRLGVGEEHDVLGPDRHGPLPDRRVVEVAADDHHPRPPGEP